MSNGDTTSIQIDTQIRNEIRAICEIKHWTYNAFLKYSLEKYYESHGMVI